jgi:hypothetical protein
MSLAVVVRGNPYFSRGTWLESSAGGWQEAIVETQYNKLVVLGTKGMIYEKATIAPFIMRPQRGGLDK